jgi:hypothetical protein
MRFPEQRLYFTWFCLLFPYNQRLLLRPRKPELGSAQRLIEIVL